MDQTTIRCSFCARTEGETERLIAGFDAAICKDCIETCAQIVGVPRSRPADADADLPFSLLLAAAG